MDGGTLPIVFKVGSKAWCDLSQTGHVPVIANLGHLLPGVTACCDSLVLLLLLLSQLIFKKVINDIAQLYHSDDY